MIQALALAALLTQAPGAGRVSSEVRVGRILVDALVLDARGNAIPDLSPASFRATVAGREVAVEAADWIPAASAEGPKVTADGARNPEGRLLLFVVQTPRDGGQMLGLLRFWHAAAPLLDGLLPTDRAAVLAWGGHLRLIQDFTGDAGKVRSALRAALRGGAVEAPESDGEFPALAPALRGSLEGTTTMERGLEAIGAALTPIAGSKALVFLGWGLAVNHAPSEADSAARADAALRRVRTAVFTLDSADADFHTLEMGLTRLSASTGGLYAKTNVFPRLAVARVAGALAGRYLLVLVAPEGKTGPVDVELVGRRGSVAVREN